MPSRVLLNLRGFERPFADPEVQKYFPEINALTGYEVSKIMEPLPYSDLK